MMSTELSAVSDVLDEVVRRLVATLQPERIYLFGSRARGDADGDSDLDILVIVKHSDAPQHRRAQDAYHTLWGIRASLDVLVWIVDEFERQVPVVASLPATVVREGRLLYAA